MAEAKRVPDPRPSKIPMTPVIVERLLAANDHNRNLRSNQVAKWKGIFLRGEYIPLMDTMICIAGTLKAPGHLWNGQHRLHGLLDAWEENPDLEVAIWIVDNVPAYAQTIMDTGIKRSLADVLKLNGERDSDNLAAVIKLSYANKMGQLIGTGGMFTNNEMLLHFEQNEWLRDGLGEGGRIRRAFPGSKSGMCYAMACAIHVGGEAAAEDFTDRLVHGEGMKRDHPIMRLREQFFEWTKTRTGSQAGPLGYVIAATIINTWNVWRRGDLSAQPSWIRYQGGLIPDAQ